MDRHALWHAAQKHLARRPTSFSARSRHRTLSRDHFAYTATVHGTLHPTRQPTSTRRHFFPRSGPQLLWTPVTSAHLSHRLVRTATARLRRIEILIKHLDLRADLQVEFHNQCDHSRARSRHRLATGRSSSLNAPIATKSPYATRIGNDCANIKLKSPRRAAVSIGFFRSTKPDPSKSKIRRRSG